MLASELGRLQLILARNFAWTSHMTRETSHQSLSSFGDGAPGARKTWIITFDFRPFWRPSHFSPNFLPHLQGHGGWPLANFQPKMTSVEPPTHVSTIQCSMVCDLRNHLICYCFGPIFCVASLYGYGNRP